MAIGRFTMYPNPTSFMHLHIFDSLWTLNVLITSSLDGAYVIVTIAAISVLSRDSYTS